MPSRGTDRKVEVEIELCDSDWERIAAWQRLWGLPTAEDAARCLLRAALDGLRQESQQAVNTRPTIRLPRLPRRSLLDENI